MDLRPPPAVRELVRRLESEGFETWAVGGAVRDAVLGLGGGDWDLATRAHPARVRRLFRRTVPIGMEHGTVGVVGRDGVLYEVTTFRRDVETFGRHAVVEFAETIEEDLARRDFTCNALAWHPLTGELRDPFGGLADLRAGVLRTVGDPATRFAEDYLRVLRALRFAGHFRWQIDEVTWRALVAGTERLPELSAERIREELWKIVSKTPWASASLALYAASGCLAVLYPELERTIGVETDGPFDLWTLSLRAVDAVPPARPLLRIAALLHGIGKPAARSPDLRGGWRFTGHEPIGARAAEAVLRRLKASNADTARVARLVRHQSNLFPPDAPGAAIRRWLRDVGPDLVNDLFRLRFALARAAARPGERLPADLPQRWCTARRTLRAHPPLEVADLAIGGAELRELGLAPGPVYGQILRTLVERVLDDPALNTREALLELVRREMLD